MIDERNYPLLHHNTFGMDVRAERFIEYTSADELQHLLRCPDFHARPWLHIGGGSNLLFAGDYPGTVLHSAIHGCTVVRETASEIDVRVGAGEVWDDFVSFAVARGWYGAENLSLIPGETGASAVQNIGAYGVEAKDLIVSVETLEAATGNPRTFTNVECRYGYRESIFKGALRGQYIVTHVTYRLSKVPAFRLDYGNVRAELERRACPLTLEAVRDTIVSIRRAKLPDPAVQGNAGSFFMNPVIAREQFLALQQAYPDMPHYDVGEHAVKVPAAWLIDRLGWKGRRVGRAGVHDRQPLVLVNCGGATGEEVMALAEQIRADVHRVFGIDIRPEVNYIKNTAI